MTDVTQFDYHLPEELIAAVPAQERPLSRLMCLDRRAGRITHRRNFSCIADYLGPDDMLVLNDARVFPARLEARRETGGKVEILLVRPAAKDVLSAPESTSQWVALLSSSGNIRSGENLQLCGQEAKACVERKLGGGYVELRFDAHGPIEKIIGSGKMPLPPYIRKVRRKDGMAEDMPELDGERYQTVYASKTGAVAAPTAGLHFTKDLLNELERKGVEIRYLTLLVGPGTFMPVRTKKVEEHKIESENFHIAGETAAAIKKARQSGRRIVATGTTTVRVLEHLARSGNWTGHAGSTDLYIYPPFEFKLTDALITNFHLPKSTLLMLVSAFAGRENILSAYREAVKQDYRFYSYGDATFIY